MTVGELREILDGIPNDAEVSIVVEPGTGDEVEVESHGYTRTRGLWLEVSARRIVEVLDV